MASEINTFLIKLGERMRLARKDAGLTQIEVANHLGIGKNAISRYERGDVEAGTIAISMIAKYLDVSVDWLLHGEKALNTDHGSANDLCYENPGDALIAVLDLQADLGVVFENEQLKTLLGLAYKTQLKKSDLKDVVTAAYDLAGIELANKPQNN